MTLPRTAAEVLSHHVLFEIEHLVAPPTDSLVSSYTFTHLGRLSSPPAVGPSSCHNEDYRFSEEAQGEQVVR